MSTRIGCNGAGDGNRTHVTSLEGWNSTIELHPQTLTTDDILSNYGLFVNAFAAHFLVSIPFYFLHHHPLIRKKRRGTRLFCVFIYADTISIFPSLSIAFYQSHLPVNLLHKQRTNRIFHSDGESPASGLSGAALIAVGLFCNQSQYCLIPAKGNSLFFHGFHQLLQHQRRDFLIILLIQLAESDQFHQSGPEIPARRRN